LKFHHLADHQGYGTEGARRFIKDLSESGWKIVYLRRDNLLRRTLSGAVAKKRGGMLHVQDDKALRKVSIDTELLLQHLDESRKLTERDDQLLSSIPHLRIDYETGLLDPAEHTRTTAKIFSYLGLGNVSVSTALKRTSTDDLSQTIENYEELEQALNATPYERFLRSA